MQYGVRLADILSGMDLRHEKLRRYTALHGAPL
jgi:hypothetical protein